MAMNWRLAAAGFLSVVLGAGCASTGGSGSQIQATIVDTHKRVVQMDRSLEESITKLNQTTAELNARVDRGDEQMRLVGSLSEENQHRLEALERRLAQFQEAAYRQWGLTPPGTAGAARVPATSTPAVVIEPPAWQSAPREEPVEPAPAILAPEPAPGVLPAPEVVAAPPVAVPPATTAPAAADGAEANEAYQRAQRLYAQGSYAQALELFGSFLGRFQDPEMSANAQFWKAKCHLNLGQYQDAIGEFQQVVAQYPGSTKVPYAKHNQAVAHSRLGQTDAATRLLEEVVRDYPNTPAADQARSDLRKLQGN
jgi:tol-pal system protein YbgF